MTRRSVTHVAGGITAPQGFLASGISVGIKKTAAPDLALVVSTTPGPIAGLFTTNRVAAAPVILDRAHLRGKIGRAIIVNSGCANACTGARGLTDADTMADLTAAALGITPRQVFVGSTGVIGRFLPMARIKQGLPALVRRLRRNGGRDAARAIMTTDLTLKEVAVSARIGGRRITVGGMAKGSGMIHPDMATMLAYLTTDAALAQPLLQRSLAAAVEPSFNSISVDGDTSTNDTVLCLANGLAGNAPFTAGSRGLAAFQALLDEACHALALQICRDGEGVTKVVQIDVRGAATRAQAKQVAKTIATSCLVKTALFGEDANWGRIMAAIGRSGVPVAQHKLGLAFDAVPIVTRGVSLGPAAEKRLDRIVRRKEFTITVTLGQGRHQARLWTTDLSYEYVKINASYRS